MSWGCMMQRRAERLLQGIISSYLVFLKFKRTNRPVFVRLTVIFIAKRTKHRVFCAFEPDWGPEPDNRSELEVGAGPEIQVPIDKGT